MLCVFWLCVEAVTIFQRPSCNSMTSLPGVVVGNRKFFIKTINGCWVNNRYFVLVFRQVTCITSVLLLASNCLLVSLSTIYDVVFCRRSLSVRSTVNFLNKPQYQSVRYNCTAPLYRVYRQAVCCLQTGQFFCAHSWHTYSRLVNSRAILCHIAFRYIKQQSQPFSTKWYLDECPNWSLILTL
jgi:hypothetical protein